MVLLLWPFFWDTLYMWNIVVVMLKKQFTIDGYCIEGLQNSFDHLLNRPVTNFIQWSDMGQLNSYLST